MTGRTGILTGGLLAAATLQWGLSGLLLIALTAACGYAAERWLWPRRQALWEWLRAGKRLWRKEGSS